MPRRSGPDDEPSLFDLPLERDAPPSPKPAPRERVAEAARAAAPVPPPDPLPLFAPGEREPRPSGEAARGEPERGRRARPPTAAAAAAAARAAPSPAVPLRARLLAGLADLLVHAAAAVAAVAGAFLVGARPRPEDWPPFAVLLLVFSFLYTVVPLAFWGQTLGMAWRGLVATTAEGEALTFEQTALRWLGGLLTCATLGLPLLLPRRRSPGDWLSGTVTGRRS
jgi:uncharacterized RDD family membrane protein YckC